MVQQRSSKSPRTGFPVSTAAPSHNKTHIPTARIHSRVGHPPLSTPPSTSPIFLQLGSILHHIPSHGSSCLPFLPLSTPPAQEGGPFPKLSSPPLPQRASTAGSSLSSHRFSLLVPRISSLPGLSSFLTDRCYMPQSSSSPPLVTPTTAPHTHRVVLSLSLLFRTFTLSPTCLCKLLYYHVSAWHHLSSSSSRPSRPPQQEAFLPPSSVQK